MSIDGLVQFLPKSECWQQFNLFHKLNQHLWHNQYTQHTSTEQHGCQLQHASYVTRNASRALFTALRSFLKAVQTGVTGLLLLGLIMVVCDHTTA